MQPPTTLALSDWLAYVEQRAADQKRRAELADEEGLETTTGNIMSGAWIALDELAGKMRAALQSEPLEPAAGLTGTADVRRLTEERDRAERICLLQDELIDAYYAGWGRVPFSEDWNEYDSEVKRLLDRIGESETLDIEAMRARPRSEQS